MKGFFKVSIIIITIIAVVAILTKPDSRKCYTTVETALKATQHQISLYIKHDKEDGTKPVSSITVKDRIFYKEIYFYELGLNKKVAIAAFTRVFLISDPK